MASKKSTEPAKRNVKDIESFNCGVRRQQSTQCPDNAMFSAHRETREPQSQWKKGVIHSEKIKGVALLNMYVVGHRVFVHFDSPRLCSS